MIRIWTIFLSVLLMPLILVPKSYADPYNNIYQVPKSYTNPYKNTYQMPKSYTKPYNNIYQVPKSYTNPYKDTYQMPKSYTKPYKGSYKTPGYSGISSLKPIHYNPNRQNLNRSTVLQPGFQGIPVGYPIHQGNMIRHSINGVPLGYSPYNSSQNGIIRHGINGIPVGYHNNPSQNIQTPYRSFNNYTDATLFIRSGNPYNYKNCR